VIIQGRPLKPGWTGKLWAVSQGVERAAEAAPDAAFVLLTDADIEHDPDNLRRLVAKAESGSCDLVSLLVRLRCRDLWERLMIPAFVFFFQKLYPFPWVNSPIHKHAAAAGGCMLVRRSALSKAGGIAAIRGELIDDCALARALKPRGRIWLGLSETTRSLRSYGRLGDLWRMVARSAYEQLGNALAMLVATVLGMVVVYLGPPAVALAGIAVGSPAATVAGAGAWLLMGFAYRPTLGLYGRPVWDAVLLPVAAVLYTLITVDSARRFWQGQGGAWKGRTYRGRLEGDG
jgi:hopene-associated glycosyltransferase HpnB